MLRFRHAPRSKPDEASARSLCISGVVPACIAALQHRGPAACRPFVERCNVHACWDCPEGDRLRLGHRRSVRPQWGVEHSLRSACRDFNHDLRLLLPLVSGSRLVRLLHGDRGGLFSDLTGDVLVERQRIFLVDHLSALFGQLRGHLHPVRHRVADHNRNLRRGFQQRSQQRDRYCRRHIHRRQHRERRPVIGVKR